MSQVGHKDRKKYQEVQIPLYLPVPPPPEPPSKNPSDQQCPGFIEIDPDDKRGVIIIEM